MNKRTLPRLRLSPVLLLFVSLTAGTAWAQNYAKPNGTTVYTTDGDCGTPAARINPCSLSDAVQDATDGNASGNGSTVFVALPNIGATVTFQEDLVGSAQIDADVTFDTFVGATDGGFAGFIAIDGDIAVDGGATMTIVEDVEVRIVGQPGRLELHDTAVIDGDGFIAFTTSGGEHLILLGESTGGCVGATPPNTAHVRNMRVDRPGGEVKVVDECPVDDESHLFITNRLQVDAGTLDMNDNNLRIVSLSVASGGDNPGVEIVGSAVVRGSGTTFIEVEEPADVPQGLAKTAVPVGFANTSDGCFVIDGAGDLMMALDKRTNAGVCIDLDAIGAGGFSFNRAGTLFVREALTVVGSFANESLAGDISGEGARTEFWKLETITTNLEIYGPGEEVLDPFLDFITAPAAGHCETGGKDVGNESGVYFFTAVTVERDLVMFDADDPDTTPCIEGLWFMADPDPDDPVTTLKVGDAATHQTFSTIKKDFTADDDNGIFLDAPGDSGLVHNVAFEGDLLFDEAPVFTLVDPADAFPRGDLCNAYTREADGNKVLFTGASDQTISSFSGTTLDIASVQINKTNPGDEVEIDASMTAFLIGTTLEVINGTLVTNGLLDANSGGIDPDGESEGATVVVNGDEAGDLGSVTVGTATRAYLSDAAEHTPRKVKYVGGDALGMGDEIPGVSAPAVPGVTLDQLEIYKAFADSSVTVGKHFTVSRRLSITQGKLDLGTSTVRLGNVDDTDMTIEIGDGSIGGSPGAFEFPTVWIPGGGGTFTVGTDGIDLLYFGTTDVTAGLEWPPSASTVPGRYVDADIVRDVTIDPVCDDVVTVTLDAADDAFRFNGALTFGDFGSLDPNGNMLEGPLTRYVATGGDDTGNACINPSSPCATIGHAVSEANAGDTIDVAAGTYPEPGLLIEKNLIIQGPGVVVQ